MIVVILATLYSSIEMIKLDSEYGVLIHKGEQALQSLTETRVRTNRFWQSLYKEIAQQDVDKMRLTEIELDTAAAEFNAFSQKALRDADLTGPVQAALSLFNQAVWMRMPSASQLWRTTIRKHCN